MAPETFERVRGIVARYLSRRPEDIKEDTPLADVGLDSLGALEVAFEIEEAFRISIPDDRVSEFKTLRAACDAIDALSRPTPTS
jgi:acyl carrier protein